MALLGIDLGTSSVKVAVCTVDSGAVIASAAQEYPILTPAPGLAEQRPEDYWQAAVAAVRQAIRTGAPIEAVSFSGQMHGMVLLDRSHEPVRPAIIWADARAADEPQRLLGLVPEWAQIAGTNPAAGFQCATFA